MNIVNCVAGTRSAFMSRSDNTIGRAGITIIWPDI